MPNASEHAAPPGARPAKPVRTRQPLTLGRVLLYAVALAAIAAIVGYGFGWYRAYPAEQQRDRAMVRLRLSEARARALDGTVSTYRTNWGDASTHFQEGVRLLEAFKAREQRWLSAAHSTQVDEAAALLREARDLAMQTSLDANSRGLQAAGLLHEVYRGTPEP
jgi:hypothetical protein